MTPRPAIPVFSRTPRSLRFGRLPTPLLARALWLVTGDRGIALCLHRVHDGARRAGELQPGLSIESHDLDRLLTALLRARPADRAFPLIASFDDGYRDAVRYIDERAPRFPDVTFVANLCPEKLTTRAGFRWDAYELSDRPRELGAFRRFLADAPDPRRENRRRDLAGLADDPRFELASVAACRAIRTHPNVRLGNHTNAHLPLTLLNLAQVSEELARSFADFETLFGDTEHLALPFGGVGRDWSPEHGQTVARHHHARVWSTESRPYSRTDVDDGAVLPRFPVLGDWTVSQNLAVMVSATVRARARELRGALQLSAARRVRAIPA